MNAWDDEERRKPLNAWLYPGKHDWLISEMKRYRGDRSELIIKALENYLSIPAEQRRDPTERLVEEIAQLRQAVQQLPSRIISQMGTYLAGMIPRVGRSAGDNPAEFDTKPMVASEDLQRRRENRMANRW